jgi:hypothetical protein
LALQPVLLLSGNDPTGLPDSSRFWKKQLSPLRDEPLNVTFRVLLILLS